MSIPQQEYEYAISVGLRQAQAALSPSHLQLDSFPYPYPHDPHTLAQHYAALADHSRLGPASCGPPPHTYAAPPAAIFDPARSAAVLQNLQHVIDSTHTSQVQRAVARSLGQPAAGPGGLAGALDPATGDFQPVVQHQRLRTQHACDACRKRKAKCSGHVRCRRCFMRNLVCSYGERNMRGPNKRRCADAVDDEPTDRDEEKDYQSGPHRRRGFSVSSGSSMSSESTASSSSQVSTSRDHEPRVLDLDVVSDGPPPARRRRASTFPAPASASGQSSSSRARERAAARGCGRRSRPPSMSFAGLRDPHLIAAEYARNVEFTFRAAVRQEALAKPEPELELEMAVRGGRSRARPTSLPAHLVNSYSRAALHVVHGSDSTASQPQLDADPSAYLNFSYDAHTPSASSPPRAHSRSSSSDGSAPLSLPESPTSVLSDLPQLHLHVPTPIPAVANLHLHTFAHAHASAMYPPDDDLLSFDYNLGAYSAAPLYAGAFGQTFVDAGFEYEYAFPIGEGAHGADIEMDVGPEGAQLWHADGPTILWDGPMCGRADACEAVSSQGNAEVERRIGELYMR